MTIVFVIGKIALGGVTSNTINLANSLIEKGVAVKIIALHGVELEGYQKLLNPKAQVVVLHSGRSPKNFFSFFALRRELKHLPESAVVFSAVEYVNILTLMAAARTGAKVISTSHTNLGIEYSENPKGIHILEKTLAPIFYKQAKAILAVSSGVAESLKQFNFFKGKVHIVYNPAAHEECFVDRSPPFDKIEFVACGRLTKQKNFSFLLESISKVKTDKAFHLTLLGDGPDRDRLQELVKKLDLQGKVTLAGYVSKPCDYFKKSHCLLVSSLWEGFGNVIVEALASGMFVISTDCPSGPNEIILNEKIGALVPLESSNAFVEAIEKFIENMNLLEQSSGLRVERAKDFTPEKISEQYLELAQNVLN